MPKPSKKPSPRKKALRDLDPDAAYIPGLSALKAKLQSYTQKHVISPPGDSQNTPDTRPDSKTDSKGEPDRGTPNTGDKAPWHGDEEDTGGNRMHAHPVERESVEDEQEALMKGENGEGKIQEMEDSQRGMAEEGGDEGKMAEMPTKNGSGAQPWPSPAHTPSSLDGHTDPLDTPRDSATPSGHACPPDSPDIESALDNLAHSQIKPDLDVIPENKANEKRALNSYLDKVRLLALAKAEKMLSASFDLPLKELVALTKDLTELQILIQWNDRAEKALKHKDRLPSMPPALKRFSAFRKMDKVTQNYNKASDPAQEAPDWAGDMPE